MRSIEEQMKEIKRRKGIYQAMKDLRKKIIAEVISAFGCVIMMIAVICFLPELRQVSEQEHLIVEKSGKRGKRKVMKQIDLKEYIKDLSVSTEGERTVMEVTLPSSSQFGVNPRLFLDKFLSETGEEPVRIRMMREAMYIADGILFE